MKQQLYTVKDFTGNLRELGDHFGINHRTLYSRLCRGWKIEDAVSVSVDKIHSCATQTAHYVGKFYGTPDVIEKRFGLHFSSMERKDSELMVKRLRNQETPKFYTVWEYKGSLKAISYDFACPLSTLKAGIKAGMAVEAILEENGCALTR